MHFVAGRFCGNADPQSEVPSDGRSSRLAMSHMALTTHASEEAIDSYSSTAFKHLANLIARTGSWLQIFSSVCWLIPLRLSSRFGSLRVAPIVRRSRQRILFVCIRQL